MIDVAQDLREEGAELKALLEQLNEEDWARPTPFKNWTPWDVVAHLHWSDRAAVESLKGDEQFAEFVAEMMKSIEKHGDLKVHTVEVAGGRISGPELLERWDRYLNEMCDLIEPSAEDRRCKWFGPDMGVRMFTTARLMETWSHAHDIYDLLGQERQYNDRIRSIAHIGVKTFGWTFVNRKLPVPPIVPHVRLTAPSGAIWEWNDADADNCVRGLASEFCHVVTQGRNIADTDLEVMGDSAQQWMAIAQCFAGPPEDPPAPGVRTGQVTAA